MIDVDTKPLGQPNRFSVVSCAKDIPDFENELIQPHMWKR